MRIINGDCLIEIKNIPDESIDLIITDPPYSTITGGSKGYENKYKGSVIKSGVGDIFEFNDINIKEYIGDLYRVLKNNTHCYIMVNNLNLEEFLTETRKIGFKLHNVLIWEKGNKTANRWYMKSFEFILFLYKGKAKYINNLGDDNILRHKNHNHKYYKENFYFDKHPTEKPVSLWEQMINNSSNEGDLILDPFMGNGSSGVACKNLNRDFIGIELDEQYFNIAQQRLGLTINNNMRELPIEKTIEEQLEDVKEHLNKTNKEQYLEVYNLIK